MAVSSFAGLIQFFGNSSAGDSTFTCQTGFFNSLLPGEVVFDDSSTAGSAILIANNGVGAPGGLIRFLGASDGGAAQAQPSGSGTIDLANHEPPGMSIGSLASNGTVSLGTNNLTIGSNHLSTIFSGIIQDAGGGSITKIGRGKLTLLSANSYTGGTTLKSGSLVINNITGSATGSGPVQVSGGSLEGDGVIADAVTIGKGRGRGAILAPGLDGRAATLTIQGGLTFKAGGTYNFGVSSKTNMADQVIANGVTILRGALFSPVNSGGRTITPGTVFTAIKNTAATAIAGTFGNLADGSTIIIGSNSFLVSYEGGDGNDLTLTVL